MAYKMKNSPLKQFGVPGSIIGSLVNQQNQGAQNLFGGSLMGAMTAAAGQAANAQQMPQGTGTMGAQPTLQAEMPSLTKMAAQNQVKAPTSVISPTAETIRASKIRRANMTPMTETPINPKAFSNANAIKGVNGRANSGAFTRTVQSNEGPMMQLANPDMLQDGPQLPPEAVQTSVTPTLGFENN